MVCVEVFLRERLNELTPSDVLGLANSMVTSEFTFCSMNGEQAVLPATVYVAAG